MSKRLGSDPSSHDCVFCYRCIEVTSPPSPSCLVTEPFPQSSCAWSTCQDPFVVVAACGWVPHSTTEKASRSAGGVHDVRPVGHGGVGPPRFRYRRKQFNRNVMARFELRIECCRLVRTEGIGPSSAGYRPTPGNQPNMRVGRRCGD